MKIYDNIFRKIIHPINLFRAWDEFIIGKKKKADVMAFSVHLEKNIFDLCYDLKYHSYKHDVYHSFFITDPKLREIHKATVRDRVLHHAIFRILNPIFEPTFINDSFSCRLDKVNHKGVKRLAQMINKVSANHARQCFVLKCDIKKFFDSIDHQILLGILQRRIIDADAIWLLKEILYSFSRHEPKQLGLFDLRKEIERETAACGRGIPIGNLTSQLFANIYMNEFDQFVKHKLKVKYYARYTDDFVIVSDNRDFLESLLPQIESFLKNTLRLKLHPEKVSIRKYQQGIDFLGYVVLPHHCRLRTKTKKRIFKKLHQRVLENKAGIISDKSLKQTLNSYLGVLSHANAHVIEQELLNKHWFWLKE